MMKVKTKRKIAEAAGWALLLLALGIMGGAECGTISLGRAAAEALAALLAGAGCLRKAGVLRV